MLTQSLQFPGEYLRQSFNTYSHKSITPTTDPQLSSPVDKLVVCVFDRETTERDGTSTLHP